MIGESLDSLGVALVVGGIFGFGAFIEQFWAVAAQREFDTYNQVTGRVERLHDLHDEYLKLEQRIEALETEQNGELDSVSTD